MSNSTDRSTDASTFFADAIAERVGANMGLPGSLADLEEPVWVASVRNQVSDLQRLRPGWDGFGAGPIRRDVLDYAGSLLEAIMMDDTPPPQVTPMSHEGILLEWHELGIDLEIEIETAGEAWVSIDKHKGKPESWPVKADFRSLSEPLEELTTVSSERAAS
jgi:hypothetical protein